MTHVSIAFKTHVSTAFQTDADQAEGEQPRAGHRIERDNRHREAQGGSADEREGGCGRRQSRGNSVVCVCVCVLWKHAIYVGS